MNPIFKALLWLCALSTLAGCAHPIRIDPDIKKLPIVSDERSPLIVGYYISDEERKLRVITEAGGGDRVEYAPYQELEAGLYRVLGNVFTDVRAMKSIDDQVIIADKGIALAFRPAITTTSSSTSMLTWPPTDFQVRIEIKATDPSGKVLWTETVQGKGNATFSEFTADHGLSGRRASEAALKQLQTRLQAASMSSVVEKKRGQE